MTITVRTDCEGTGRRYLWAYIAAVDAAHVHGLRHQLVAALDRWVDADVVDTTALLSSELLGNALQHARAPDGRRPWVTLSALLMGRQLRVEVTDPDPHLPEPHEAGTDEENGRGMALMDALAEEWGICPYPEGKTVWFSVKSGLVGAPE